MRALMHDTGADLRNNCSNALFGVSSSRPVVRDARLHAFTGGFAVEQCWSMAGLRITQDRARALLSKNALPLVRWSQIGGNKRAFFVGDIVERRAAASP